MKKFSKKDLPNLNIDIILRYNFLKLEEEEIKSN
jgi:hypothetical protein